MFKKMIKIFGVCCLAAGGFSMAEDEQPGYEFAEEGQVEIYLKENPPQQEVSVADNEEEESSYSFCDSPMQEVVKSAVLRQLHQSCDEVTLEDLGRIQHLMISGEPLESIGPEDFEGLENLNSLQLYDNYLQSIEKGSFKKLNRLRRLVISHNMLAEVDEDIFSSLADLDHLNLSNNLLQKLPKKLLSFSPRLQYLNLSHGVLTEIDEEAFSHLYRLKYLGLSNNKLTEIKPEVFAHLAAVVELDLSYNQLKQIDVSNMRRLVKLNLSHNQLAEVRWFHFKFLAELDVSHNELTFIPWGLIDMMQALTFIDYSANSLRTVEVNPERDSYDTGVDKEWYDCWLRACGNIYAYISVNGERYKFMKCRGDQEDSQCTRLAQEWKNDLSEGRILTLNMKDKFIYSVNKQGF